MFGFGVVTFGPAPCYLAAHFGCCIVIIFCYHFRVMTLSHDKNCYWNLMSLLDFLY